jgi:hypothetical protein
LAAIPGDRETLARLCAPLQESRDWDDFFRAAQREGVRAVLFDAIVAANLSVPEEILRRESQTSVRESMFHSVLVTTLQQILVALDGRGIKAVPLKGPILAERFYGALERRPSSDLDLLLLPEELDPAADALSPLGYRVEGGHSGRYFRAHHHHVHLLHATLPIIELHYHAYRGFGITMRAEPLLRRAVAYESPRWKASVLSPEDELVYLAVHAASHRFENRGWLYDLKLLLLTHPHLDWSLAWRRAEELGVGAVLSLSCELLAKNFGVRRAWQHVVPSLGPVRAHAAGVLMPNRDHHWANAVARLGFNTVLCFTPAVAARSAARFLVLKMFNEIPRRIAQSFFGADET